MYLPPILLTSSVTAMDPSVLLKDQELRIFHTLESMHHWSKIAPKNQYVVCDGSGFDFSTILKQEFPHLQIECLSFLNNADLVKKHGKGFGEGEIILYALDHSHYLKESNWFAKCTAKLWVENFQDCVLAWNSQLACKPFFSNVFSLRKMSLDYVDTRFYLVKKAFYLQHLSTAHIGLGGDSGISIEDKYLDLIKGHDLRHVFLKNPPIIAGVGGGSASYYNTSPLRQIKEILRSRIASLDPRYRDFFIP